MERGRDSGAQRHNACGGHGGGGDGNAEFACVPRGTMRNATTTQSSTPLSTCGGPGPFLSLRRKFISSPSIFVILPRAFL